MPKEGEEALVTAMKGMWVGYLVYDSLTGMTDSGLESRNSSPRGLRRRLFPELRDCWTTPRELSFLVRRQTRRQDTLPP